MSIIINLFGRSIRCWICEIPIDKYYEIYKLAQQNNISINEVFFDLELLNKLGYEHWSEIHSVYKIHGFTIDVSNRIEIKKDRRVISKFTTQEILNENTLFKLYNTAVVDHTVIQKVRFKYITLGQEEIGGNKYKYISYK